MHPLLAGLLLLLMLLAAPCRVDGRVLLGTCEDQCDATYKTNRDKCIVEARSVQEDVAAAGLMLESVTLPMPGADPVEIRCINKQDQELSNCKQRCTSPGAVEQEQRFASLLG